MPNPLKKKNVTLGIRKHVLHNFTNIFIRQKRLVLKETKPKINAFKIHVDFFPRYMEYESTVNY